MFTNLKYKPSAFLINFSMPEIVKRLTSPSGLLCAQSSRGGSGTGTGHGDHQKARYRKNDSFSCHLKQAAREIFDEAEFILDLKETIEKEIARTGARVTGGSSGSQSTASSFHLEYAAENITGRIEITGGFIYEENFRVKISFDETSASQKTPVIERPRPVYQPTGFYHVVAFAVADQTARDFYEKGNRAAKDSAERFRQKVLATAKDNFRDEDYRAVMYAWTRTPDHIKEKLKDSVDAVFELPADYDNFDQVYFLNDLMLQMYREAGEDFEVTKIVSAEEVKQFPWGPSFRGYYVPKDEQF